MKVAIVRQRYTPFGGAERFIARALPALERAGARISLIARRHEGWDARSVITANPPYLGNWWRDASFARAARRTWRREHFDIVQSHERIPGCDIYRAGDGVHRRWIELRRSIAPPGERLGLALNPYHRYVMAAEKEMFEHPRLRAVICNSNLVRDEIRRYFRVRPEQLHVIYNGIDLSQFNPQRRRTLRGAARERLELHARDMVFLFVGSGFARKGLDTAIRALAAGGQPGWRLLVAGKDRHSARYAALAAELGTGPRVQLLGAVQDIVPLYCAADCFILPTRYDPFPNTALEALALGIPIIVSTQCGAAEIVQAAENGWLCEPGDVRGLTERMREADSATRDPRLADAARATAERFDIDAMAQRLVGLYTGLSTTGTKTQ